MARPALRIATEPHNETAFQIETGVPTPTARPSHVYPFHLMEVGDSFLVPRANIPDRDARRVRAAACLYGSRNGKRFSVRIVDDGVRVWRAA